MSVISSDKLWQVLTNTDENKTKICLLFTSMTDGAAVRERPDIVLKNPNRYIADSIFFDFQHDIVDSVSPISNTMPSLKVFEDKVSALGICNEDHIIVYDDFGNFCASRVWFMFKAAGFNNIQVLSGGLPKWLNENRETTGKLKAINNAGNFSATQSTRYKFVDKAFVLSTINDEKMAREMFDARSLSRYLGAEPESRPNLRSGHIPTSKSLYYQSLQDKYGQFIAENEAPRSLRHATGGAIFSCGSGVTACILAQYADLLGISPLYVYDGSWAEWGADLALPIETSQEN